MKDILFVDLTASVMQLSMSIMMFMMNIIIKQVGGIDGVALFSAGWRVATMASMPLLEIATVVVSVTGVAYGTRTLQKVDNTHVYALKIGLIIETKIAVAAFVFAPVIAAAFTQSTDTAARIGGDIITFLRIICIYYPTTALGMLSFAAFQGFRKGIYSLIATLLLTIILIVPLAWILAVTLELGLVGAW